MKTNIRDMSRACSMRTSAEGMAEILQQAISALGERQGSTKLNILSYIKSENPMLSYPNKHNLVFYLQQAIKEGMENKMVQEINGRYTLVSAKKSSRRMNRTKDIPKWTKPVRGGRNKVLSSHTSRHERLRDSLTPIGNDSDVPDHEPRDKRRKHGKHGKRRHKGRRGSKRRRRRRAAATDAASDAVSGTSEPMQVSSEQFAGPEQIPSNLGSELSSADDCNKSGSAQSVPSAGSQS